MSFDTRSTETTKPKPGPAAFSGFDSSVFTSWAAAVADLLACSAADQIGPGMIPNAGGLIYSLVQAAQELIDAENERGLQA